MCPQGLLSFSLVISLLHQCSTGILFKIKKNVEMPSCYRLRLPKIHMLNLIPKVMVLGGGPPGGEQVMKVEPS